MHTHNQPAANIFVNNFMDTFADTFVNVFDDTFAISVVAAVRSCLLLLLLRRSAR